jgi:hypothetical protein
MNSKPENLIAEITREQREPIWPGRPTDGGSPGAIDHQVSVGLALAVVAYQSRTLLPLIFLVVWIAVAGIVISNGLRRRRPDGEKD